MKDLSLYIHIPFCMSKCYYCDFTSFPNNKEKIQGYIDSLIKELELYKERIKDYNINTIFIGGGTPSCIDANYIYRILEYINCNFNISKTCEISIETNPGTLNKEKVKIYKESGINRVSMGVQSLNEDLLKVIGRIHNGDDFYKSLELLRKANFNNINVDLMFGLPGQTLDMVLDSLKKVVELNIEHISYYSLILEENTKLYNMYNQGKINLPNEDVERDMYHKTREYLINRGYEHYEISNYALSNYECKHNLTYWNVMPYLGVGLGSHSNIEGKRFWNTIHIDKYIEKLKENIIPIEDEEIIDINTEIEEFCILGLRKIQGIDKKQFKLRFNNEIETIYKDIINKHVNNGLVINSEDFISLTNRGLDLANLVEMDFLR